MQVIFVLRQMLNNTTSWVLVKTCVVTVDLHSGFTFYMHFSAKNPTTMQTFIKFVVKIMITLKLNFATSVSLSHLTNKLEDSKEVCLGLKLNLRKL
jgi:uncharacterized membrane protein YeiH